MRATPQLTGLPGPPRQSGKYSEGLSWTGDIDIERVVLLLYVYDWGGSTWSTNGSGHCQVCMFYKHLSGPPDALLRTFLPFIQQLSKVTP